MAVNPKTLEGFRNAVTAAYTLAVKETVHPPDADIAINAAIQTIYYLALPTNDRYAKAFTLSVPAGRNLANLPADWLKPVNIGYRVNDTANYYPATGKSFASFLAMDEEINSVEKVDATAPVYQIIGTQIEFLPAAAALDAAGAKGLYFPAMALLVAATDAVDLLDSHLPMSQSLAISMFFDLMGQQAMADRWMKTTLFQVQTIIGVEAAENLSRAARSASREQAEE